MNNNPPVSMRRSLGALELSLLGVGGIIGTGIFVLSGQVAAHHAGPAVILSFAMAGGAALLAALCYSELASMFGHGGGAYAYVRASLGEVVAWLVGWDLLLEYMLAAASVSVGWSAYVHSFLRNAFGVCLPRAISSSPWAWDHTQGALTRTEGIVDLPAMAIVLALTGVLVLGVRESSRFNMAAVFIKIVVVMLFLAVAGANVQPTLWQPFVPANVGHFGAFGWSGVLQGTSILFFAYNGFDAVSTGAEEARCPERDVPRAIIASVVVAALLYLAMATVLVGLLPYAELGVPHPVAHALHHLDNAWLRPVIEVGAIAGLTSVMLVNLYSQPRIARAMAQDGLLPAAFARLSPRFRTPVVGGLVVGGVCAAAGGLVPIELLEELMCVGTLFAFTVVGISVVVLRVRRPDAKRTFRVPGGFMLPVLSVLVCGILLTAARLQTIKRFACWLALGMLLYGARRALGLRGAARPI